MTSNPRNASEVRTKDGVKFGRELREKEFLFDKTYMPLNHGMLFNLIVNRVRGSKSCFRVFPFFPLLLINTMFLLCSFFGNRLFSRTPNATIRSVSSQTHCGTVKVETLT